MIRLLKLWYWRTVYTWAVEDLEDLDEWMPILRGPAVRAAMREREECLQAIAKATVKITALSGRVPTDIR